MTAPRLGLVFTHARYLDPDWTPGPGQRYGDAPHARMTVTRVTDFAVYYRYAAGGGRFVMDRAVWNLDGYGAQT